MATDALLAKLRISQLGSLADSQLRGFGRLTDSQFRDCAV
jgi:hypothetical protein